MCKGLAQTAARGVRCSAMQARGPKHLAQDPPPPPPYLNSYCGWTKSCTTCKTCLKPLFVGLYRRIIVPEILRCCEMDFASIHSIAKAPPIAAIPIEASHSYGLSRRLGPFPGGPLFGGSPEKKPPYLCAILEGTLNNHAHTPKHRCHSEWYRGKTKK